MRVPCADGGTSRADGAIDPVVSLVPGAVCGGNSAECGVPAGGVRTPWMDSGLYRIARHYRGCNGDSVLAIRKAANGRGAMDRRSNRAGGGFGGRVDDLDRRLCGAIEAIPEAG